VKMRTCGRFSLLLLTVLIILSGCGNREEGSAGQDGTGVATDAANLQPVTIRMFQSSVSITDEQFNSFFVEPVGKKYPHITMELVRGSNGKAEQMVAAGEFPDMIFTGIGSINFYKELGLLVDLNPYIQKAKFNIADFEPRIIEQIKVYADKGELFAIPFLDNYSALFYNRDIFDKYGMAYPKDGMTWDEAIALARQISDKSSAQVASLCPGTFSQFSSVLSLPVVDPKTNKAVLETDKWKMLVDKFTTIHQIPGNVCRGSAEATDFKAGKIAMAGINGGLVTELEEMAKQGPIVNWDLATYPQFPEAPGLRRRMDVSLLMLSSSSKHPDDVFRVMQAVSAREEHLKRTRLGRMSTLKDPELKKDFAVDLTVTKGRNMQAIFKTSASAVPPFTKYNGPANSALEQAVKDVLNGADINSALRKANERANQEIAAMIEGGL